LKNPLPVELFSAGEAARRTWPLLIEAMLEAVCLVEPEELRVVAANVAAGRLLGAPPGELVGKTMHELAATPEDECFWLEVAEGISTAIVSESYVSRPSGAAVPVVRRVSRIEPAPGNALYVVALNDRSEAADSARAAEWGQAELQATLESVSDGVLVVDLAGHIRHFNRRFAAIWDVPEEMLALHADDEIFDWLRRRVADPLDYVRRLAEIEGQATVGAVDRLALRSGGAVERVSVPQLSSGRPIGRVFTYRDLR